MDAKTDSKINMYRTVRQICDDNPTTVASNPAFSAAYATFKAKLSALNITITAYLQIITGIATDKTTLKKNLCTSTTDICKLISAYASSINNNTLLEAVNFTYSDLYKIKSDKIHEFCQNIHDLAVANAPALIPYGITNALLLSFQQAITDYTNIAPKPQSAKATKKSLNKSINTQTKDIDTFLETQLDKLIIVFKPTKIDFVNTFIAGRVIIDPNSTTTQIKMQILDSMTKTPLKGATVQINGPKSYTLKTNVRGYFTQKPIDPGEYNITITLDAYQPLTIDLYKAKLGKINKQKIELISL